MGKMNALALDREENFINTCRDFIEDDMRFVDYYRLAITHSDLVNHLSDETIADIIRIVWDEVAS